MSRDAPAALILAAVRSEMSRGRGATEHRRLPRQGDCASVVRRASDHGVLPLVERACRTASHPCGEGMVATERRLARAQSMRLAAELCILSSELEARGVRWLAFKGPTLAVLAWGDVTRRQFGDLDLLVGAHDIELVEAVLRQRGYTGPAELTPPQRRALEREQCAREWSLEGAGVSVDLHWELTPPSLGRCLPAADLLGRRRMVHLPMGDVPTAAAEDLLLLACQHGSKHAWAQLGWVVDVAMLATSPELNWRTLAARAQSETLTTAVWWGIELGRRLLGAPPPMVSLSAPLGARIMLRRMERRLRRVDAWPGRVEVHLAQLLLVESWRGRARWLTRQALMPRESDWSRMPALAATPLGFVGWRLAALPARFVRAAGRTASALPRAIRRS